MNDRPFIVIGAGGHAKVVVDLLQMAGHTVAGLTDIDPALHGMDVLGVPIIGDDDALRAYNVDDIALALGVGQTRPSPVRRAVYARLKGGGLISLHAHTLLPLCRVALKSALAHKLWPVLLCRPAVELVLARSLIRTPR